MHRTRDKRIAAATAAVQQMLAEQKPTRAPSIAPGPVPVSPWKLAGRIEIMKNRTLWQRRITA